MNDKKLWVVSYTGPEREVYARQPKFSTEVWKVGGSWWVWIVRATEEALRRDLDGSPYWCICGQPVDGRHEDLDGNDLYIVNGEISDMVTCAKAWNITPQMFGAETWDDVDRAELRAAIPA